MHHLRAEMELIDLNTSRFLQHASVPLRKENADELRENSFCAVARLRSRLRISALCRTIQRKSQGQELHLLGPVSDHGLCAIDLSRKSERYRGQPAHGT